LPDLCTEFFFLECTPGLFLLFELAFTPDELAVGFFAIVM
jgi:hypothetical protein